MMNNEEEHKQQKQQGVLDPESELGMRGFKTFMSDVTQETIKPIIDWIIAENFNKEKKQLLLSVVLEVISMLALH